MTVAIGIAIGFIIGILTPRAITYIRKQEQKKKVAIFAMTHHIDPELAISDNRIILKRKE